MHILLMSNNKPTIDWSLLYALPSGLNYTNASANRSYFDAAGVMQFAAINQPRFYFDPVTHDAIGLLVEGQRTNVVGGSSTFAGWNLFSGATGAASSGAPDGSSNVRRITTASVSSGIYKDTIGVTASTVYTTSAYYKWVSGSTSITHAAIGQAAYGGTGGDRCVIFNGQTGEFISKSAEITSYRIDALPNGYFRVSASFTPTTSTTAAAVAAKNVAAVNVFDIFGFQVEAGTFATSYIPTTVTSVTRAADQLSYTIPVGVSRQRLIFDDASYQDMVVSDGAYTLNASTLNRTHIKNIQLWRV